MSEKSRKRAPAEALWTEFRAEMKGKKQHPTASSRTCDSPRLAALLPRYDDLDPVARAGVERHVASCAECSRKWDLLVAADQWLAQGEGRDHDVCPSADELYDYGRGPGHAPLPEARRAEIDLHVGGCAPCSEHVRTLRTPVPIPWIAEPPLESEDAGEERPKRRLRRVATAAGEPRWSSEWNRRGWIAGVAAAAVLLFAVRPFFGPDPAIDGSTVLAADDSAESGSAEFPAWPVLRGAESDALLFPRGPVLADATGERTWSDLEFRLAEDPEAEGYRVRLHLHAGGAFDEGELVADLRGDEPVLSADQPLGPGHYTWEAFAVVRGLEQPLGERDFHVQSDEAFLDEWNALDGDGAERVRLLHDRGYLGDARAYAETLPPSPERDAYLAGWPGR